MALWLLLGLLSVVACSSTTTNEGGGSGSIAGHCEALCAELVAAACDNGLTMQGCSLTCKALTSAPECDPTGLAYFDCAKGKPVTCDATGSPEVPACASEYGAAIDCALTASPNPAITVPCAKYCDAIAAKGCEKNAPKDACNDSCRWAGATGIGCDAEWESFLICATSHALTCVAGYAAALACGAEFKAYHACVNAAGKG